MSSLRSDSSSGVSSGISTSQPLEKATVVAVISSTYEVVPGTTVKGLNEQMTATILQGNEKGKTVTLEDDYVSHNKGDSFYIQKNADRSYWVGDASRLPTITIFAGIFVVLVLLIGGLQGLSGVLCLVGSLVLILYVLLPAILHGFSPVIVSIVVSSFIIILGSYITHGFNKTTTSAVIGMIVTVVITGILLGGIMIGLLGVLYDIAILAMPMSAHHCRSCYCFLSRQVPICC